MRQAILGVWTALLVGLVATAFVAAQTSVQTQRGSPPTPNAQAPEYAPAPGSPAKPPVIEPAPGKPSLAPAPGTVGDRGQIDSLHGSRTIFGLRHLTAFLVGLGIVGAAVLVLSGMTRAVSGRARVRREFPSRYKGDSDHQ
jgi:hypothetical protein